MKEIIVNPVTLIKNGEEVPIHGITDVNRVSDVQINGESVVSGGVATIPLATDTKHGIAVYRSTDYRTGIKITSFDGTTGIVSLNPATESRIASRTGNMAITPQNLEYAVTSVVDFEEGTSEQATFVEESDLEHYVKDTDYASETKAGIILAKDANGLGVLPDTGLLYARNMTLSVYNARSNASFISKGTLENIKESLVKSVVDKPFNLVVRQTYDFSEPTELDINTDNVEHFRIFISIPPNATTKVDNYGLIGLYDEKSELHYGVFELGGLTGNAVSYGQVAYAQYDLGDIPTMAKWASSGGNPQFTIRGGTVNSISIDDTKLPTYKITKIKLPPITGTVRIAVYTR